MDQVIITGAPSTGKSTLIEALSAAGYRVSKERARHVIEEQLSEGGNALPWIDNSAFSKIVLDLQLRDLKTAPEHDLTFFDRGIPDVLAYFKFHNQLDLASRYSSLAQANRYYPYVFFLPLWKDIYNNDSGRKETFEEAQKIDHFLRQTYQEYGYKLIELPFVSSEERLKFILHHFGIN